MIYAYGARLPGGYHKRNNVVCQDYFAISKLGERAAVAAVADGLGSVRHSDEGSKIAALAAVGHCAGLLAGIEANPKDEDVLDAIGESFALALREIRAEAASKNRSADLYDTTLTLAALIGEDLYFGQSGDSGIIALLTTGEYARVTVQQRDELGRVFPLCFQNMWVVSKFGGKTAAALLATDGMLELFSPSPAEIRVPLAEFFMNNMNLKIQATGENSVAAKMSDYMDSLPESQVNDDKTVAVLINARAKVGRQPKRYYAAPAREEPRPEGGAEAPGLSGPADGAAPAPWLFALGFAVFLAAVSAGFLAWHYFAAV